MMESPAGWLLSILIGFGVGFYFHRRGSKETPEWVKRELIPKLKENGQKESRTAVSERSEALDLVHKVRNTIYAARRVAGETPEETEAWKKLTEIVQSAYDPLITEPPSGRAARTLEYALDAILAKKNK